jgi:ribonuclease Y
MSIGITIIIAVFTLVLGVLVGYIIRKSVGEKAIGSAELKAKNMILDAENRAETIRKEYILEAKANKIEDRGSKQKGGWFVKT